jgi:hypothetical protein
MEKDRRFDTTPKPREVGGSRIFAGPQRPYPARIVICCDGTSCRTPPRLSSSCDGHKTREKAKKSKHQKIRDGFVLRTLITAVSDLTGERGISEQRPLALFRPIEAGKNG